MRPPAVLPVAEDVDVQLDLTDVRRAHTAQAERGQHVNKTESPWPHPRDGHRWGMPRWPFAAPELRARPGGFARALRINAKSKSPNKQSSSRWSQPVTVRQNPHLQLPAGAVTDHRIQFTSHALTAIMGGDIEAVNNALACGAG